MDPVTFLKQLGVPRFRPGNGAWRDIRRLCGRDYEAELSSVVGEADDQVAAGVDPATALASVWRVMYRDVETALATHVFSAHVTRVWLDHTACKMPDTGRLVDVGCGPGIIACWHAINAPDLDVVGFDREPSAVKVATEVAARLQLSNVEFHLADWNQDLSDLGSFDYAISVTGMYGDLPDFDTIARDYVSPADMANHADKFTLPSVGAVASLLTEKGRYDSLERIPTPPQAWVYWFALQAAGAVDIDKTTRLEMYRADEQMPLTVATRGGSPAEPATLLEHGTRLWGLSDTDYEASWFS